MGQPDNPGGGLPGYTVTAIGPDGEPRPDVTVEIGPVLRRYSSVLIWLDRGRPRKLCIDGREYHRRQARRKKRR